MNDIGPNYATRDGYAELLAPIILRIPNLTGDGEIPVPEEQQSTPELEGTLAERIAAMDLSIEAYDAMVASVDTSYIEEAEADSPAYNQIR